MKFPTPVRNHWIPLGCVLLFLGFSCLWIGQPGVQNDEALFGTVLFEPRGGADVVELWGWRIPTMMMTYLGGLKGLIYLPIFALWAPSAASMRIPAVLVGALTLWLSYLLLRRLAGERAAKLGCVLLATDVVYLLTIRLDWGPVALQHLFLVGGFLALVRFHDRQSDLMLALAFFLFGLGLWDKALFSWVLVGLLCAAVVAYPRKVWNLVSARRAGIAAVFLAFGALPLLIYNLRDPMATFRTNATLTVSRAEFFGKLEVLRATMDGSSLFGYMPRDSPQKEERRPETVSERFSVALNSAIGHLHHGPGAWLFLAAFLSTPLLLRTGIRGPVLFTVAFIVTSWLQMCLAKGAGGSSHHAVLIWPFPVFLVAMCLSESSRLLRRYGRAAVLLVVLCTAGANAAILNHFYALLIVNGSSVTWSDAIYDLSRFLGSTKADRIIVLDWGMLDSLRLLNRGALPLWNGIDQLNRETVAGEELKQVKGWLESPGTLFLSYTPGNEFIPGIAARLSAVAGREGYRKEVLRAVEDRNGRPIFEVFRFQRRSSS